MPESTIPSDIIKIALSKAEGWPFERFVHDFYPHIAGEELIPLGGVKDGGADGFSPAELLEGKSTGTFYQVSVQSDHRAKIRSTVKRLKEFERTATRLIYVTSVSVKHIDIEEGDLSKELGLSVSIRDSSFITSRINESVGTRAAFESHLRHYTDYLKHIGKSSIIPPSKFVSDPAIFVFLRQQVDRMEGSEGLINTLADGLILWALEETDPEEEKFLNRDEIIVKILTAIPSSKEILSDVIPTRLDALAKIPKGEGRPLRWHKKDDHFCLSFDIRRDIESDNTEDERLRLAVLDSFQSRVIDCCQLDLLPLEILEVVNIAINSIIKMFEHEGLKFAAFVNGEGDLEPLSPLSDHIENCLDSSSFTGEKRQHLKEAVLLCLKGALYASIEEERLFFKKLSATYTLLFSLNNAPRVVEYFESMASDFNLYVGTDMIVRALSERYLRPEDQPTRNTLKIIRDAGGTLVLSEGVVDEVYSHIRVTDNEFIGGYKDTEPHLTIDITRNIDRILMRTYFYAKLNPPEGITGPKNWGHFINQFCDYNQLHKTKGKEQIRTYLMAQFGLEYEDEEETNALCNKDELNQLSSRLEEIKSDKRLAHNDAMMVLAVYGKRKKNKEHVTVNEYGYRTWWLTGESRILRFTCDIQKKYSSLYMMRPEFILNFLALAPSAASIRKSFRSVFPSTLGIRLARRVDPDELQQVMNDVKAATELEPGRRTAKIAELSDKLKGDFRKKYRHSISPSK